MNKALFIIPIILGIGLVSILPLSYSQVSDQEELEECRDGLIIVYLINGNTYTCKTPETAERWVELGLAQIVDPEYEPIVEEPEPEPLSIFEKIAQRNQNQPEPEPPGIIEELPFDNGVEINNQSETASEKKEEHKPEPPTEKAPDHSNKNELPGTPRKLGQQSIQASGILTLEVYDKDGNLKHRHSDHNLVVDVGLESLADLAFGTTHVSGESAGGFTWISVGTGGTAPANTDTDCQTQHGNKKQDLSVTNTALGAVLNVSWVAELGAGTLQEICLTDNGAAATGNLFSRQTYTGVPILATDTVNAEWTITFADSNGT